MALPFAAHAAAPESSTTASSWLVKPPDFSSRVPSERVSIVKHQTPPTDEGERERWRSRRPPAYLLVVLGQSEADLALGSRGWGDQLPKGLKDLAQLLVLLAELRLGISFELFEPLLDRGVGSRGAA